MSEGEAIVTNQADSNPSFTREFHTAALRLTDEEEMGMASAVGAAGPYENGGFIVIGHPDKTIRENGICAVIVEENFYGAIPVL